MSKALRLRPAPKPAPERSFKPATALEQWQLQIKLNGNPTLFDVEAVSRDVAWFCSNNTVYRTTDAGRTWLPTTAVTTIEDFSISKLYISGCAVHFDDDRHSHFEHTAIFNAIHGWRPNLDAGDQPAGNASLTGW